MDKRTDDKLPNGNQFPDADSVLRQPPLPLHGERVPEGRERGRSNFNSMNNLWTYIFIMVVVTNLIRIIPPLLIRGQISNRFLRSFLYYVPYVTLAVMTFPAITEATSSPLAGAIALVLGIIAAWFGLGLFPVSVICCLVVLIIEYTI